MNYVTSVHDLIKKAQSDPELDSHIDVEDIFRQRRLARTQGAAKLPIITDEDTDEDTDKPDNTPPIIIEERPKTARKKRPTQKSLMPSLKTIAKETLNELNDVFGLNNPLLSTQVVLERKRLIKNAYSKLSEYRLINEVFEIHAGKHVRWIRRKVSYMIPVLTVGGIVMDVKFLDTGTHILVKANGNRFVQFKYDDCIIFQKLSAEELMIFTAQEMAK